MNQALTGLILIPLAGYLLSVIPGSRREKLIFYLSISTVATHILYFLVFSGIWIAEGCPDVYFEGVNLYETGNSHFSVDFFFDVVSAVYFLVASILMFLVTVFSRYYIHREKGYKRFFNNILFFYLGLSLILFAGNFETLFIGWEFIGVTSFFLIAFYRDRYLPVKNALKVVSLYRIADVFLLLGIWICHHYFEQNLDFNTLKEWAARGTSLITEEPFRTGIPLTFLVVALVKSAQFPFSTWLPRAMEGPTTSSAIFYGSLSVHIGVFLLLRTYPLWEYNPGFKIIVFAFGLLTSIPATFIARVQSTVKTQIAYSSIAQIGMMFIEVSLGLHSLALLHFAGNAFLRTYQLLVSPSVLSYLIHDQFFHFIPPQTETGKTFMGKVRLTIYMLGIKEWNLDSLMYRYLWVPMKKIGNSIHFVTARTALLFLLPLYAVGVYFVFHRASVPLFIAAFLPPVVALVSLVLILRAFTKRNDVRNSWLLIIASQLFMALAISFNEQFDISQVYLYLSGIVVSAVIGYLVFNKLTRAGEGTSLDRFHGHSYEHPHLAVIFLVACLGLAGFPVTPTFIGEDLILGHVHANQFALTLLIALSLILDGLAVFRIYARLFLGPHEKTYHEIAYRSS